jgi:hypothetical protein
MSDPVRDAIERGWPAACAAWSPFLLLGTPADDPAQHSIAQIDLGTRRVSINGARLVQDGLVDCVEALLAHEVGHHVRYPGSLVVDARMRLLERGLIPFPGYSMANLFTDLLINERLGARYGEHFVRVYRSSTDRPEFVESWTRDPAFVFVLSLYEALWRLPPGAVLGPVEPLFAARYPGYRADAALVVQNLFAMHPNLYAQFLYFLSFVLRYLAPFEESQEPDAAEAGCHRGQPSPDDWAAALTPTAREREAIERAIREGWFGAAQKDRLESLADLEARMAQLPGLAQGELVPVPEIMAAYYRQQAELYLFRPPPQRRLGEAVVPTTLEEWDPSDGAYAIDWLATLTVRGPEWGAAAPLVRTRIAEHEGTEVPLWQPRVELYLDVSGSMPDPCLSLNAMTLAAQILSMGATRAGGRVRAALYSGAPVTYWQWCRSELELSKFLMHYVGGGTEFPFELLHASLRECGREQPIRVIITDTDFDHNVQQHPVATELLREAVRCSPQTVLLQHLPSPDWVARYRELGMTVVAVPDLADYPRMARDLAWSLFPETGG